jgi:hypothetical protein
MQTLLQSSTTAPLLSDILDFSGAMSLTWQPGRPEPVHQLQKAGEVESVLWDIRELRRPGRTAGESAGHRNEKDDRSRALKG